MPPLQLCMAQLGLYIGRKKFGVRVENLLLGGAKRSDRRWVWKFLRCKNSAAYQMLCLFV